MSCIIINEMRKEKKGEIRIIGGKWKGKKIYFNLNDDLRPTPDRAKETLFNWLGQDLNEMHCLDLFSGTGALGLEALSRGAKKVTFVEKNKDYLQKIKKVYLENDEKIKLILVGSISLILMQTMIHIGVNIRLFPTTGMTLPFISYGGSSIISISILSGVILNLTKRKIN